MEYPKSYWQLQQYIQDEAKEILRSEVVNAIDLSIWSQEIGERVFEFYLASKDHSQIDKVYEEILGVVKSNHQKIKKRINSPLIRSTSLDEVLEQDQASLVGTE